MFKGVVFDLDGTLVDSPLCFKSIREQLGIPQGEFILEFLERLPAAEKAEKLEVLEAIELKAAQAATPFPGVLELLKTLGERQMKLGIFTRNCRVATRHIVEIFKMTVDLVVTRDDAPPKPDPAGLYKFLSQWQIEPLELLYVGDFRFDIECGKRAGVRTALFTNGQAPAQDLSPDYVIPHFSEFLETLG